MVLYDELRIILTGSTGSGISSTGNTILQGKDFKTVRSAKSATVKSKKSKKILEPGGGSQTFKTNINGKRIIVFDNPGYSCNKLSKEQVFDELRESLYNSKPGPHAFIYVLKIGRLPSEEEISITTFLRLLGEEVLPYVLLVFTYKKELDGMPLDKYISTLPKTIREFSEKCGHGMIAIDNNSSEMERFQQMQQIVHTIHDNASRMIAPYFPVGVSQLASFEKRKKIICGKTYKILKIVLFACGIIGCIVIYWYFFSERGQMKVKYSYKT